jgi:PAS domain S-box-containing protein
MADANTVARRRELVYLGTFLVLACSYYLLRASTWLGSMELHTIMETAATLLALNIGILALVHYYSKKNNIFLFVGTGFVATGFLDGYHALVTSSFFTANFPSAPPHLVPWSWLASRLFLSVLLWLSWVFWKREERLGDAGKVSERWVYAIVGVLALTCFISFAFIPLPRAYYPNMGFPRPQESVPAVFFFLAMVGCLRKGLWRSDPFEHWLVMSLLVGFMGEAVFMSSSGKLYDAMFDAAHVLKKLSYICALTGLLISMYVLFKRFEVAKTKLAESEERFRLAMLRANDGLWDWNLQTDEVYYSPRWKSMLGYAEEELESHLDTWKRVIHPDDLGLSLASIRDFLEGRADKYELEFRLQHKNGHYRNILSRATLVRGAAGEALRLVGTHVDITARKLAEEALRESEQRYHTLFDQSPDGIVIVDLSCKIVQFNDVACRQLGYTREEFSRLNISDIDADESPTEIRGRTENILDAGGAAFDVRHKTKLGEIRYHHVITQPIVLAGETFLYAIWQDITERKQTEEQVQQSLVEKETLLRELYHRTKNNMQVIISLLNLQCRGIDDEKTLNIFEDTKSRIHSMALVHEKLYEAKNLSQVYLNDYIKDLAQALMKSHNAGREQITLHLDVKRIPVSIDTITPLGLVINELMTNALKYAFPGNKRGEIVIKAGLNEDETIELTFSDNGVGMPKSINLDKAESLGLTIVRTLVASQIKGKLEMQTQNGTAFIIRFRDKDLPARI